MIFTAILKEAARSLYGAKQRTLLALIGIMIGIGSVIAMVSIGTIVEHEALKQFRDMGTDILLINKMSGFSSPHKSKKLSLKIVHEMTKCCNSIVAVAPYIDTSGRLNYKGKGSYVKLLGVTSSFMDINKLKLKEGRFISDLDGMSCYCVLGSGRADELKVKGLVHPLGSKIKINRHLFTVIGVLRAVPTGGMRPYGINHAIFIPIQTVKRITSDAEINDIMVKISSDVHYTVAKKEIIDFFKRKLPKANIDIRSAEEIIQQMEKQMKLFTLLLGAIGSISLLVGGVGVMNVMLVSVTERRREIGIRRALGARKKDIQMQFITESVILCLIGGIMGIFLGIISSYIISKVSKWEFMISYLAIILGFGVSTLVGLFFGFYPANQAARLDPIAALKSE